MFQCQDLEKREGSTTQLCIKFSENYKVLTQEIRTISRMRKAFKKNRDPSTCYCGYPSMRSYGIIKMITPEGELLAGFYVMRLCQMTLDAHINSNNSVSVLQCFQIAIELLDTLELLHETGRTYNDLKLNNIMLDFDN